MTLFEKIQTPEFQTAVIIAAVSNAFNLAVVVLFTDYFGYPVINTILSFIEKTL